MVPGTLGGLRRGQAGVQAVYIHGGEYRVLLSHLVTFIGYSFHRVLILYETVTKVDEYPMTTVFSNARFCETVNRCNEYPMQ